MTCRLLGRSHSDWCEMVPHSGFLIICKNSKTFSERFIACVHSFTFYGTQFWNSLRYGVLFSQGKKWAGQKQHTFHSVGSPLLSVEWACQVLSPRADGCQIAFEFAAVCPPIASYLPRTLLSLSLCLLTPTDIGKIQIYLVSLPQEIM